MGDKNSKQAGTETQEVSEVVEMSQDIAEDVHELGRELRERAEDIRKEVVKQLQNAAATIRERAQESKNAREMLDVADTIAHNLEKAANYINARKLDEISQEATKVVKRNPWRITAIVFAIGVILGLFLRRDDE